MTIRSLCNLFLIVCFFCNIEGPSYVYANPKEQFSVVWGDTTKRKAALECLQQCISDEKSLLSVTKHLIGHEHVLDISEIHGKLSANFLFVLSAPNVVNYLKFLRGLYNIMNEGTNGHSKGALFVLKLNGVISSKLNALKDMQSIFEYGVSCEFVQEQSRKVLERISKLGAILEISEKLELALKAATTLHRQLEERNQGTLRNLEKRIPKEIRLYQQAGLDTAVIERITATPELIQRLKENPQPLIDYISKVKETTLPDISNDVSEIEDTITELFFKTSILDDSIRALFVKFTVDYLQNFLSLLSSVTVSKNTSEISKSIVGISFEKVFSGEEFKVFILSSLKESIEVAPPEKDAVILLILKSVLDKASGSLYNIDVNSEIYSIISTYIATFFPCSR